MVKKNNQSSVPDAGRDTPTLQSVDNTGNVVEISRSALATYDRLHFSFLWDRVCSIFSGARKFCVAHGLRQLIRDTKSDVNCFQTSLTRRNEKL